jgi:hypothetical protein
MVSAIRAGTAEHESHHTKIWKKSKILLRCALTNLKQKTLHDNQKDKDRSNHRARFGEPADA